MLCTLIHDAYRTDEREEVHNALETLVADGQPDWSRMGVYAYWDRTSHEILYLGLASDLPARFAQHNALVTHGGGNKRKEIDAYFSSQERLGFTILLQSKAIAFMEQIQKIDPTMGATAARTIAVGEGQLIEMRQLVYGKRPAWNATGGASAGKRYARPAPALLELLAARRESLFAARRPLRVLIGDFGLRLFEATIHASRMRAAMHEHGMANIPRPGEQISARRIERMIMLRDGRLVEELDASDAEIRRWIELLGKPEHWRQEAAKWLAASRPPAGRRLTRKEDAVLALLSATAAEAAPPAHIVATREILAGGYLDGAAQIP